MKRDFADGLHWSGNCGKIHSAKARAASLLDGNHQFLEEASEAVEEALMELAKKGHAGGRLVMTGPESANQIGFRLSCRSDEPAVHVSLPAFFDSDGTEAAIRRAPTGKLSADDVHAALACLAPIVAEHLAGHGITVEDASVGRVKAEMDVTWMTKEQEAVSRAASEMPGGLDALVAGVPPEDLVTGRI